MSFVSLRTCTLTMNPGQDGSGGHVVQGWADEDESLTMPTITLANVSRGADAKMQASSTGNDGGPVEIKLLATSPSTKYFGSAVLQAQKGNPKTFDAYLSDTVNKVETVMRNGVLTDIMPGPSLGQGSASTVTYTIEFETIHADYSGSKFTDAPTTD